MAKRSNDWHVTGWRAVALLPIALPLALLIKILPIKKTRDRTPAEVSGFLRDFRDGTGGDWDWDDFTSVPISDPVLDAIRIEADRIELPMNQNGREKLEGLFQRAESIKQNWLGSK